MVHRLFVKRLQVVRDPCAPAGAGGLGVEGSPSTARLKAAYRQACAQRVHDCAGHSSPASTRSAPLITKINLRWSRCATHYAQPPRKETAGLAVAGRDGLSSQHKNSRHKKNSRARGCRERWPEQSTLLPATRRHGQCWVSGRVVAGLKTAEVFLQVLGPRMRDRRCRGGRSVIAGVQNKCSKRNCQRLCPSLPFPSAPASSPQPNPTP
eukprot:359328-Chlamydomonas_euryale.AAC.2